MMLLLVVASHSPTWGTSVTVTVFHRRIVFCFHVLCLVDLVKMVLVSFIDALLRVEGFFPMTLSAPFRFRAQTSTWVPEWSILFFLCEKRCNVWYKQHPAIKTILWCYLVYPDLCAIFFYFFSSGAGYNQKRHLFASLVCLLLLHFFFVPRYTPKEPRLPAECIYKLLFSLQGFSFGLTPPNSHSSFALFGAVACFC